MIGMPATLTGPLIRREIGDDHICLLTFDRPESGANIFDAATLGELNEQIDFVENDASLRGLVITSAKKSIFIAGADLKTLLQQAQAGDMRVFIAEGQRVLNRIVALKIPTVAAIHGACAGGGYEITLACDHRIATDDPANRIGLPETTLGLIPAWGGCTRLPRLIGPERAADVILKGKLYSAREALKLGLVDEVASRDQLLQAARKKLRDGKRAARSVPRIEKEIPIPRETENPAPGRALEVIKRGLTNSIEQALALELDAIVDLGKSESTQNLIRNFFLNDKYRTGTSKVSAQKVVHAAVIAAGELADSTVSPEHVIGLHFFNPVSRMKLVEVVIGKQTSDETRERTLAFARQVGKLPVIVRDSPGFLVNRVLFPYLLDAAELFESGVEAEKIDSALVQWGMPMGPLRLIDEIGVDIVVDIGNTLEKAYRRRDHVPAVLL